MKTLQNIILATFLTGLLPFLTLAADPQATQQSGTFGEFEVGLPGITDKSIDNFIKDDKPILKFIGIAVNVVIAALVIIGVISIVIGGYMYMTAGGNGAQVTAAKTWIQSALVGIFLSLISVVVLNTINRYLGSDAAEPVLGETGTGTPKDGGDTKTDSNNKPSGANPGGNESAASLPSSNAATTTQVGLDPQNGTPVQPQAPTSSTQQAQTGGNSAGQAGQAGAQPPTQAGGNQGMTPTRAEIAAASQQTQTLSNKVGTALSAAKNEEARLANGGDQRNLVSRFFGAKPAETIVFENTVTPAALIDAGKQIQAIDKQILSIQSKGSLSLQEQTDLGVLRRQSNDTFQQYQKLQESIKNIDLYKGKGIR